MLDETFDKHEAYSKMIFWGSIFEIIYIEIQGMS